MRTNLLMKFNVDRGNSRIIVDREFAAPISQVWAAWTQPHLLDQWWAPKPWKARTKKMDFTVGGYWLYAMVGPEGEEHWGRNDFRSIEEYKSFSARDSFCNENGDINKSFPQALWTVTFSEKDDHTLVHVETQYESLEALEKILEMGMQEGFTAALENLDAVLEEELK